MHFSPVCLAVCLLLSVALTTAPAAADHTRRNLGLHRRQAEELGQVLSAPGTAYLGQYGAGADSFYVTAGSTNSSLALRIIGDGVASSDREATALNLAEHAYVAVEWQGVDGDVDFGEGIARAAPEWFAATESALSKESKDAPVAQIVHSAPGKSAALVAVPKASADTEIARVRAVVPRNTHLVRLPEVSGKEGGVLEGLPTPQNRDTALGQHTSRLAELAGKALDPDSRITDLIGHIKQEELKQDIEWLTGENPQSPIKGKGRLATSDGYKEAANWMSERFKEYGCASVTQHPFRNNFGPNVVCEIPGTGLAEEIVILGAHLDSIAGFWSRAPAPGGNDDGSGSTMLLASLRALQRSGLKFRRTVRIVAFGGEEQGLVGSAAYAKKTQDDGEKVVFMLQGDMLAYHKPGEPMQCGLPNRYHDPSASALVTNVGKQYTPKVTMGVTTGCCSDHQSFYEVGVPATALFERNGRIADPKYHNAEDWSRRPGYDLEQVQEHSRIAIASVATVAEIAE